MDKLSHYRALIKQLLADYEKLCNQTPAEGVETHAIFDETRDRYMIFRTGWWRKERISSAVLYLRSQEDKIWIEEDGTEDGIAHPLLGAGVPKTDIVLGFHYPAMRPLTEFATV